MGSGKSTVGRLLAERLGVPFADADERDRAHGGPDDPARIFEHDGEPAFRELEAAAIAGCWTATRACWRSAAARCAGDGDARARARHGGLARRAGRRRLDARAAGRARRPLARDEGAFRALHAERRRRLRGGVRRAGRRHAAAEVVAASVVVAPRCRPGALATLGGAIGDRRAAVIVDDAVAHLAPPDVATIVVPGGERAKSIPAARRAVARPGGGRAGAPRRRWWRSAAARSPTSAGFAAPRFRRGLACDSGADDARRAGRRGHRRQDGHRRRGQNDVGAFHLPEVVIADPVVLETCRRASGRPGSPRSSRPRCCGGRLWELVRGWEPGTGEIAERTELVRLTAAYKARVVGEDPTEQGLARVLNLGHTIGHGVEAASGYGELLHGEAVGDRAAAALRLLGGAPRPRRGGAGRDGADPRARRAADASDRANRRRGGGGDARRQEADRRSSPAGAARCGRIAGVRRRPWGRPADAAVSSAL